MAGKIRILSIEDNPQMSTLIQFIFARDKYRVISVGRGEMGLELLRTLEPNLLLLDLMLPDINGWEIYQQMKADEHLAKIPVIILSANPPPNRNDKEHVVLPEDLYIQKPFSVDELIDAVNSLLAQPVQ